MSDHDDFDTELGEVPALGIEEADDFEKALAARPYIVTPQGIAFRPGLPFEVWESLGQRLGAFEAGRLWFWGDWLAYGEGEYGERMAQALDASFYREGTLTTAKWVCSRIPLDRRRAELSFSAHKAVAALEPDQQEAFLDMAVREGLSSKQLQAAVQAPQIAPTRPAAAPGAQEPQDGASAPEASETEPLGPDGAITRVNPDEPGQVSVETAITRETADHVAVFLGPRRFAARRAMWVGAYLRQRRTIAALREKLAYAKTRLQYFGEAL